MRLSRLRLRGSVLVGLPLLVLGLLRALPGCLLSPDDPLDDATLAEIANTDCADVTATYENFARDFFATYCLRCHSASLVGDAARTDAPIGIDFDTLEVIRAYATRARLRAGQFGDMPPRLLGGAQPTRDERIQLMLWIDCGTPSEADEP